MTTGRRCVRFNLVGAAGFLLQLGLLTLLVRWASLQASAAVALAVLAAVTHNFVWHEWVTWPGQPRESRLARWLAFNASTGAVSLVTNVIITSLVVTITGLPVVAANVVAVAVASMSNFLVSDRLVFNRGRR